MSTAEALFGVPVSILPEDDYGNYSMPPPVEDAKVIEDDVAVKTNQALFGTLSLKALREFARILGVTAKGNKADLVERIKEAPMPLGLDTLPDPFTEFTDFFKNK